MIAAAPQHTQPIARTTGLMADDRVEYDPYFEPEWCARCGSSGHNELACTEPEEDEDDD